MKQETSALGWKRAAWMVGCLCIAAVIVTLVPASFVVRGAADKEPTLVIRGGRIFDGLGDSTRPLGQLWIRGETILGEHPADQIL